MPVTCSVRTLPFYFNLRCTVSFLSARLFYIECLWCVLCGLFVFLVNVLFVCVECSLSVVVSSCVVFSYLSTIVYAVWYLFHVVPLSCMFINSLSCMFIKASLITNHSSQRFDSFITDLSVPPDIQSGPAQS